MDEVFGEDNFVSDQYFVQEDQSGLGPSKRNSTSLDFALLWYAKSFESMKVSPNLFLERDSGEKEPIEYTQVIQSDLLSRRCYRRRAAGPS